MVQDNRLFLPINIVIDNTLAGSLGWLSSYQGYGETISLHSPFQTEYYKVIQAELLLPSLDQWRRK